MFLHGSTGFVVPMRKPEMMANQLALLAKQPHLRAEMGSRAGSGLSQNLLSKARIERFSSMYDHLLRSYHVVVGKLP